MSKKTLEAGIVYIQNNESDFNLVSDVESLVLFLNTNEFLPKEIKVTEISSVLRKSKTMSLLSAKKALTSVQEKILQRYISLVEQIQTLPSLDDEITVFSDEVTQLREESPVVKTALDPISPISLHATTLPFTNSTDDLILEKEEEILSKQEALFLREKQLEAKEYVFEKSISTLTNPHVQHVLHQIDTKLQHLTELSAEYRNQENTWANTQLQYEQRIKHFEMTISKLTSVQSSLQTAHVHKQKEFEQIQQLLFEKTKELRHSERSLIRTNKQISHLGKSFAKREEVIHAKESDLKKREKSVGHSWERVQELKSEVIAKQHRISQTELDFVTKFDKKEIALQTMYESKITDLEKEYNGKLSKLNSEFDSLSLKQAHLKKQQDTIAQRESQLSKKEKEISLLKTKYELQLHNKLDEVKSVRTHTLKAKQAVVPNVKNATGTFSESLETIKILIDVANSEIYLNPKLAKKTYTRIYELYQHLPLKEQTQIHNLIVKTHTSIQNALASESEGQK